MSGRFIKIFLFFSFAFLSAGFFDIAKVCAASPQIANYYLGPLPMDEDSVNKMARFNLLILSPDQYVTRKDVLDKIKKINPSIILLAYVPSQSYNYQYWPQDAVFKNLSVNDAWWLRDSRGNIVSTWTGIRNTDMSEGWSDALISFVKNNVLSTGDWDGVFWDMVDDGISSHNGGDIDLNRDGVKDAAKFANEEWNRRVAYFLRKSRQELGSKYIVINGSSNKDYQSQINGRMYEDFPTPWELGGTWNAIMKGLEKNKTFNLKPQIYVFNGTSKNTGNAANYRRFRFGLASSLLINNVFYSFDHGTENHGQIWWYDEYDIKLGEPQNEPYAIGGKTKYLDDVWRRDYTNGIALINTTKKTYEVDLGAEYEKISGKQDVAVNDGNVVSRLRLGALNAILLLKTFQELKETVFINGNFVKFFSYEGKKSRNGFFVYDKDFRGGVKIYRGDIDGDDKEEKITAYLNKLEVYNGKGERIYNDFPFGTTFRGNLNFFVGNIYPGKEKQIIIGGDTSNQVAVLNYKGETLIKPFFPLGKTYKGGFSVAIGDIDGNGSGENILGTINAGKSEVIIFNQNFTKISKRFYPFTVKDASGVNISAGDVNGDLKEEILAVPAKGKKINAFVFSGTGKKINEIIVGENASGKGAAIFSVDVNFDKLKEITVTNL
ncbi:MAG TPA: putative glycoside hydrolase [Candidatus Magasanikbacteria bacterium]|nr:putative glycoside hydrolase [Candidatus Magasanikbacteria bacterium]